LIYCADYRCSHSIAISADRWPDELSFSDSSWQTRPLRGFPFQVLF